MKKAMSFGLLLLSLLLAHQCIYASFGKNKVLTKDFDWKICSTSHFDIYYYAEAEKILPDAVRILEESYEYVLKTYNCQISTDTKTPYYLYVGHNEFEETNIVDIGEGTGGVTEAYKNRFIVPHLGPKAWLEEVIRHEFTHVLQFNVLYSGFWRSAQLIKSIFYPNWLLEGMAVYSERDYDRTERSMYMRDAVVPPDEESVATSSETLKRREEYCELLPLSYLHSFNHVKPHQVVLAYKESGTLVEYLIEEYGADKVSGILHAYKKVFEPNAVLEESIGLNFRDLEKKFKEYVIDKYRLNAGNLKEPSFYGKKITKSGMFSNFNTNPVFLSGEEQVLYLSDSSGYSEIKCIDIKTGETRSIINNKMFDEIENINTSGRGISISGDDKYMVFVGEKCQRDYIYLFDLQKSRLRKIKVPFDIIDSADISRNGKKIIFVAMKDGCRNIYSANMEGGDIKQLTEGTDDISDAVLSHNGEFIVYSKESKVLSAENKYQRDLWLLSLEDNTSKRITGMPNDEISPAIAPNDSKVIFVSDRDNINDLYEIDLANNKISRVTEVIGGAFNPSYSKSGERIVFSSFRKGEKSIFVHNMTDSGDYSIVESSLVITVEPAISTDTINSRPYRFRASTDLFYPVGLYSTYYGLEALLYWQLSDMLGNHNLGIYAECNEYYKYYNYQATYNYLRFRPQLYFSLQGKGYFTDYSYDTYDSYLYQILGMSYPLSRFNRLEFVVANAAITEKLYSDEIQISEEKADAHIGYTAFVRDTTEGKYMEVTSGSRMSIGFEAATRALGASEEYNNTQVELHKFIPLGNENTLASRILGANSTGKDSYTYGLIGNSGVRMKYRSDLYDANYGNNILLANIEWRFPISKDLNYHMWYMFPDFLFRTFYGILFFDAGIAWNNSAIDTNNVLYSYGISLKFHSFIYQIYSYSLNFTWAYSPINKETEFYFSFGPVF